ncbi:ATP-binding protein [Actinoallomurus iriomotensis]|uniref:ATP-binding protein n=1 Tax=Actinoallomurus iriomotensis TaxID=478107 RepID=UPI0032DA132F
MPFWDIEDVGPCLPHAEHLHPATFRWGPASLVSLGAFTLSTKYVSSISDQLELLDEPEVASPASGGCSSCCSRLRCTSLMPSARSANSTRREEKASVAIALNEAFGRWTKTFTDPRLCAAIVDRLTFGGNIIETGTDSYRIAQTRARTDKPR